VNREAIYAALFAKVAAVPGFNTTSRRLRFHLDVAGADQPALFMSQYREDAQTVPGLNTVWILRVNLFLYAMTRPDVATPPAQILNPLVDAVIATLAPEPVSNKQTLGGLVQHTWVEGEIQTDEGVLGDQGIAVIPIVMKAV
jgi:hypothetical protein